MQMELLDLLDKGRAERFASARELLDEATRRVVSGGGDTPEAAVGSGSEDGEVPRTPTLLQRAGASVIVEAWLGLARDLMVTAAGQADAAPAGELLPDLSIAAQQVGSRPLAEFIGLLERIHDGLAQNAAPRLALEVAMLAWPTIQRS